MKSKKIYTTIGMYFMLAVGAFVCSLGLDLFLVPNKIAAGGVSGFAVVLYSLYQIPVGLVMILVNIPLFLLSFRRMGARFCIRTVYTTLLFSGFVDGFAFLKPLTADPILASIYGGLLMGLGFSIVLRFGATTGGTDLMAALICDHAKHLKIGTVLLMIDAAVILFAGFALQDLEVMLYAIIAIFVTTKVIDLVLSGANYGKTAYIISDHAQEISKAIFEKIQRGVTGLQAEGMYTGREKKVLLCVIKPNEIQRLKEIIKKIDENAFMILTDAKEVLGEGFKIELN